MTPAQEAAAHVALRDELDRLLALAAAVPGFTVTTCTIVQDDHSVTHVNDQDARTVRSSCSCEWGDGKTFYPDRPGARETAMSVAISIGESHLASLQFRGII